MNVGRLGPGVSPPPLVTGIPVWAVSDLAEANV